MDKLYSRERTDFMVNTIIKSKLIEQLDKLPFDLQLSVLDFAKSLVPKGIKGENLLRFEGSISSDDLQRISKAIEKSCEKVDSNEW